MPCYQSVDRLKRLIHPVLTLTVQRLQREMMNASSTVEHVSDVTWSTSCADVTLTSSSSPLDDDEVNTTLSYVYILLTTLTSILSIVGSLLLVVCDLAFRDLRSSGRRLLTWLSVADCLTAIGNLLGVTWFVLTSALSLIVSDIRRTYRLATIAHTDFQGHPRTAGGSCFTPNFEL